MKDFINPSFRNMACLNCYFSPKNYVVSDGKFDLFADLRIDTDR